MGIARKMPGYAPRRKAASVDRRIAAALPPCCLPGGAGVPSSFMDALEARPATLFVLAALIMLALGPVPVQAGLMTTLCTSEGLRQVPQDESGSRRDDGALGCVHACLMRDRRRG